MYLKNNPRIKIKDLNATKKGGNNKRKYKRHKTSHIYNPLNLRIKTLKTWNKRHPLTNHNDVLTFIKKIFPTNKCKTLDANTCVLFKKHKYDKSLTLLVSEPIITSNNKIQDIGMIFEVPIRKYYHLYKFPLHSNIYKKVSEKYILKKGAVSFLNNAREIYLPKLYFNNKNDILDENTIVESYLLMAHNKSYTGGEYIPLLENVQNGGVMNESNNLLEELKKCGVGNDNSGSLIEELKKCNISSETAADESPVPTSDENSAFDSNDPSTISNQNSSQGQQIEHRDLSTCGLDNEKFKMRLPPLPNVSEIDSANSIIRKSYSIELEFAELLPFLHNNVLNDDIKKYNRYIAYMIIQRTPYAIDRVNNYELFKNEIIRDSGNDLTEYYIDYQLDGTNVKTMRLPNNDSWNLNNKETNQFINYCKLAKFGTTEDGNCKEHTDVKTHEWNTSRKKWIRTNNCPKCLEECEKTIAKISQKIYTMNEKLNEFEGAMKENKMRLDQFNNARLKYKKQWKAKKFDRNGKCIDENHNNKLCHNVTKGRLGIKCQEDIIECPECKDEYLNYFIKYLNAFKTNKDLKHIIEIIKKNIKQLKECKQITSALTKTERLANLGKSEHSPGRIKADAEAAGMSEEDWMGLSPTQQKERLVNARKAHAANMKPDEYENLSEVAKAALDKQVHDARIAGVDLTTWNDSSSEEQANMIEKAKQREINDDSQGNSSEQSNMSNNNDFPGMPYTGMEDEMMLFRTRVSSKLLQEILRNSNLTGTSTDHWLQNFFENPSFNKHDQPREGPGASPTGNNEGQSPNDEDGPPGPSPNDGDGPGGPSPNDGDSPEEPPLGVPDDGETTGVSVNNPEEVIPPHVVENTEILADTKDEDEYLKKKMVDDNSNTDDKCGKIKNDLSIILNLPSPENISKCEGQQDNITYEPLSDTDINNIVEFPGNKCTSRENLLEMSLKTGLKNPFTNLPIEQNNTCLSKDVRNSILQDLNSNVPEDTSKIVSEPAKLPDTENIVTREEQPPESSSSVESAEGSQTSEEQITRQGEQSQTSSTEETETFDPVRKQDIDDKLNSQDYKKLNEWLKNNDNDNKLLHLLYKNPTYLDYVKLLGIGLTPHDVLTSMRRKRTEWNKEAEKDNFIQDYMTAMNLTRPTELSI